MSGSVTAYGSFCCTARIWIHFHLCFSYLSSINFYSPINFDFIWYLSSLLSFDTKIYINFYCFQARQKKRKLRKTLFCVHIDFTFYTYFTFYLAHKQWNGIITVSLSEMSESEGRFLVNNILMFGSVLCLVTSHFCLKLYTPHHPAWKETSYVYYP